jgi:cellulose synthase (UDP-forming)
MAMDTFVDKKYSDLLAYMGIGAGLVIFLYMGGLYSSTPFQLGLNWGFIALLIILKRIPPFQDPPGRILFLLIGTFITIRYWMFRTFDTLLFISFWDSLGMILLYSAETYGILIYFFGMFVSVWPLKRDKSPLPTDVGAWPAVDIFIPTYNESEEIIMTTAIACTQQDYPKDKLNIFILDDGATMEKRDDPDLEKAKAAWERYHTLRRIAETLGVIYLTRERNIRAKAGNLNEALGVHPLVAKAQLTREQLAWLREKVGGQTSREVGQGQLILMLDCDHVPARDFLKNTVGYFLRDEKLFLVQTPHFFINPNPVEKNLGMVGNNPWENEMFYGGIQLGLDLWNASFFCGSAALIRREYLQQIGGVQGDTITEDAETSLALHARGYGSVYMARPVTCGLSPETFDDFILQRSRWTQGMLQIFSLKNPLLVKGLNWGQRICYLNSCLFWFFGLARVVFFISPLLYLFFGMRVYNASEMQVLGYAVPHILGSMLVTDYLYGKVRHPFFSELYEAVQSMYLVPAIFGTLISPWSPRFKVTPKGKSLDKDYLSPLALPFYILFSLSIIGFPAAFLRGMIYPHEFFAIFFCVLWNIFNFIFVLLCLGVVWELQQRRRHHRIWAEGRAEITIPRLGRSLMAAIQDISLGGMSVQPLEPIQVEEEEKVNIQVADSSRGAYSLQASVVRRTVRQGRLEWGCEFAIPDLAAFSQIVGFVYGDSNRWVRFWELHRSQQVRIAKSFYWLMKVGWRGAIRNFRGILLPQWKKVVRSTKAFQGKLYGEWGLRKKILKILWSKYLHPGPPIQTSG